MPSFKIVEIFTSVQGEGKLTGKTMTFIRLFGCNLKCVFCDEPKHVDKSLISVLTVDQLVAAAYDGKAKWVCITGGEPTLHDLRPLIEAFQKAGLKVAVESNGYAPDNIQGADHTCLSPKGPLTDIGLTVGAWTELKVLVSPDLVDDDFIGNIHRAEHLINSANKTAGIEPVEVYIQPVNGTHTVDKFNLQACLDILEDNPDLNLSVQLHKFIGVE